MKTARKRTVEEKVKAAEAASTDLARASSPKPGLEEQASRSRNTSRVPAASGASWPTVSIIVRCWNEKPALTRLFECLEAQDYPGDFDLILVDSGSTDGTREMLTPRFATWVDIPHEDFTWGRALNLGCRTANGEYLALLSAHCFPRRGDWLRSLIEPFELSAVGLVYGRQIGDPRTNAREAVQLEDEYPRTDRRGVRNFSNANGVLPAWLFKELPFDEDMQIGEEIPLVAAAAKKGLHVYYAAGAAVQHAHSSDPEAEYRRWFWKGYVFEKHIYRGRKWIGPLAATLRFLHALSRSVLRMLRKGAFRTLSSLPYFELLKARAFHRGMRAARKEARGGEDLSSTHYRDVVVPVPYRLRRQS